MSENENKEVIFSKKVIEFITVANEYCLFIEKTEGYPREDIIDYMLKICPLIYLKGALLPECDEDDFEIAERYVTEEHWEAVFKPLQSKFATDDLYHYAKQNDQGEYIVQEASIADNLSDVYQDLKDFIMLFQKGSIAAKQNAVAECRSLFETHWGLKIISAHRALHQIIFKETGDVNTSESAGELE